ncbi:MAG: hypothetical protein U1E31_02535 [Rickettsiales bacterium]
MLKNSIELFQDIDLFNSYLSDILKLENINIDQKNELASLFLENTKFVNIYTIKYLLSSYKDNNKIDIYHHFKKYLKLLKKIILNYYIVLKLFI